jgi:transcriptional regulator with XRE-family HTH domain
MSIGERISAARKTMGIKQTQLSKMTGIDNGQMNMYEKSKCEPSVRNLKKIAEALGISADYLLEIKPYDRGANDDRD